MIEFNARFGDPETQVVLPRLVTPLSELLLAAATGTLEHKATPTFSEQVAVGVVLASEGYPGEPAIGRELHGLADADAQPGIQVVHAATEQRDGKWFATGGRVLSVVALGDDFADARARAYAALQLITLEGGQARTDIAARVS